MTSAPLSSSELYSRHLTGNYGYPLWTPQLQVELPGHYQLEGLKIGDVGVVSPRDGTFDVLFNITLPGDRQPCPGLLPEGFVPITLDPVHIATDRDALPAHNVTSSMSVELTARHVSDLNDQTPSKAEYDFSLSMTDGAIIVLPEGALSRDLRSEGIFLNEAIRSAIDWYRCATQEGGRLISDDTLYLITGFHKTSSWSLGAARGISSLRNPRSVKFKIGRIRAGAAIAEAYNWQIAHGFVERVGPKHPFKVSDYISHGGSHDDVPGYMSNGDNRDDVPNQTIFIRGFRITINKLLYWEKVSIKAQKSSHFRFTGFGSDMINFLTGGTSERASSGVEGITGHTADQGSSEGQASTNLRIAIDRMPNVPQIFHPGDSINRCILDEKPHVMVALTHDSLWIDMLQMGLLELSDFSHQKRLQEVLSKNYRVIVEDGAAYLERGSSRGRSSTSNQPHATSSNSYVSPSVETQRWQSLPEHLRGLLEIPLVDITSNIVRLEDACTENASGSLSDVYKCMYNSDGQRIEVAVRVLRSGSSVEMDTRDDKKMRREFGIWNLLDHPNIVPFLGVVHGFITPGVSSSVSLWMPNDTLMSFLKQRGGRLSVSHRLQFLLDIAEGLRYLHSFPITHCGLSPANVLLDADYTARLAGFENAFWAGDLPEAFHYLQEKDALPSTLWWTAPEQIVLESPTIKSDIYSFGSIALTVLSGQRPWSEVEVDVTVISLLRKGQNPGRPTLHPIEDEHWELIQSCWSAAESRPSAEDATTSIRRFLVGYPPAHPLRDMFIAPMHSGLDVSSTHKTAITIDQTGRSMNKLTQMIHRLKLNEIRDLTEQITTDGPFPVASGGYADVFKATLRTSRKSVKVAIKAIRVYADKNYSEELQRLRHEIKLWTRLKHDNVLPLFGITSEYGVFPAMVCPWLDNDTLTSYLERQGTELLMLQMLLLIYGIASGLQYLHSQSIVHGDLSGSNVLINTGGQAFIADFGLSTILDEIGVSTFTLSSPGTGRLRETIRWAAPELLDAPGHDVKPHPGPTTKSDVYSFGGIMLQIFTGKVPYHYYSRETQVLAAISGGETPERPSNPHVTDRRWMFIRRCWSPFRIVSQRPSSDDIVAFSEDDVSQNHPQASLGKGKLRARNTAPY